MPLLIGMPGMGEMIVILGVLLLLFGSKRIPEIARSLGRGITEFKKGVKGEDDEPGKIPPPGAGPTPLPPPPPPQP